MHFEELRALLSSAHLQEIQELKAQIKALTQKLIAAEVHKARTPVPETGQTGAVQRLPPLVQPALPGQVVELQTARPAPNAAKEAKRKFEVLPAWIKASQSQCDLSQPPRAAFLSKGGAGTNDNSFLEVSAHHLVLRPDSWGMIFWESISLLILVNDTITHPLRSAGLLGDSDTSAISWLTRFFWTIDVIRGCFTSYISAEGLLETSPRKVALRYAWVQMWLDLPLMLLDWCVLFVALAGQDNYAENLLAPPTVLHAFTLLRLLRLRKFRDFQEKLLRGIRSEWLQLVLSIFVGMLAILGCIHVVACIWYSLRCRSDHDLAEERAADAYVTCYWFVLSLFIGNTNLPMNTPQETIFATVMIVLYYVLGLALGGMLTTAMTRLQLLARHKTEQLLALRRYLEDWGISDTLSARVQKNALRALEEQERSAPESQVELFPLVSSTLRIEIHYEMFSPVLCCHPFFRALNEINPSCMRKICHTAISPVVVQAGDLLMHEGESMADSKMFFLSTGRLLYNSNNGCPAYVEPRQWVAEQALWTCWVSRGTLQSDQDARVLVVDVQSLTSLLAGHFARIAAAYATRFVHELNSGTSFRTDVAGEEQMEVVTNLVAEVLQDEAPKELLQPLWRRKFRAVAVGISRVLVRNKQLAGEVLE